MLFSSIPIARKTGYYIIISASLLVLIKKNNNDFKSRFLEVTVYKNLHILLSKFYKITVISADPCESLTYPQGSANHSLGNAGLGLKYKSRFNKSLTVVF